VKDPKVVGVVVSRDDWGLLAVSIAHALTNPVDEVFVLDHASTDQTAVGLRYLQSLWPERIRVLRSNATHFEQEAATNAVAHLALESSPDWIHVFDSDEFLLVGPDTSLKQVLASMTPDKVALRYSVNNFISPRNFDEHSTIGYRALRVRAKPTRQYDDTQAVRSLYDGSATFFDFPFVSKLIFRARELTRVTAGAHRVMHFGGQGVEHRDDRVQCAHLTLPSQQKLERKAKQGEIYVRMGMPENFGWQAQLMYRLQQEGRLDWFWARHSFVNDTVNTGIPMPHEIDHTLALALESALQFLECKFQSTDLRTIDGAPIDCGNESTSSISLDQAIGLCAALQRQTDVLVQHIRQSGAKR